jgi:hypothetical protein
MSKMQEQRQRSEGKGEESKGSKESEDVLEGKTGVNVPVRASTNSNHTIGGIVITDSSEEDSNSEQVLFIHLVGSTSFYLHLPS